MQAKTGETDDSLSLNHLVWHQLLDQKTSKSFSLYIGVISQSIQLVGKSLSLWSPLSLFTFAVGKNPNAVTLKKNHD